MKIKSIHYLTFLGYNNTEQWIGWQDSFLEVIIVVDWKEVSMNVSISQEHINTRYTMDGQEEAVELLEVTLAIFL